MGARGNARAWSLLLLLSAGSCGGASPGAVKAWMRRPPASGDQVVLTPQIGHDTVLGLAVSRDGRVALSGDADGALKVWDLETRALLRSIAAHQGIVSSVAISTDGRMALSAGVDGTLKLWDLATGAELHSFPDAGKHNGGVRAAALSADGRWAVSTSGREVSVWDLSDGRLARRWPEFLPPPATTVEATAVAFSPDGRHVLAGTDAFYTLWDRRSGERLWHTFDHGLGGRSTAFSPDGRWFVTAGLTIRDAASGRLVRGFAKEDFGPYASPDAIAFLPDGRLVVGMSNGDIPLFVLDPRSGATRGWDVDAPAVSGLAVAPGGRLITAGVGKLVVWDVASGSVLYTIEGRSRDVRAVAFSPDGLRFATGQSDGSIDVWDAAALRRLRVIAGHRDRVFALAFTTDGRRLVSGGLDRRVRIWDADAGTELHSLKVDAQAIRSIAVAPDGRRALVGGVGLIELDGGTLLDASPGNRGDAVVFSPDGRLAASAGGSVVIWDARATPMRELRRLPESFAQSVAFSPDGQHLLVGVFHGTTSDASDPPLRMWTLDGKSAKAMRGPRGTVGSVAFTPDGRFALSAGGTAQDHSVRIWGAASRKLLATWPQHGAEVDALAVSPDGRLALTGSRDGTARVWRLDTGASAVLLGAGPQWVVYTDDGWFDASRGGGRLVAAVRGMQAYRIDQLASHLNRPDLILERLGLGSPELISHLRARHQRRLAKLGLRGVDLTPSFERAPVARIVGAQRRGKVVELEIGLEARQGSLRRYNVYANDVPILGALGKRLSGGRARVRQRVELTGGVNKIEVTAMDSAGAEALRDFRLFEQPATRGDLYFIGFGVSRYLQPELRLEYAHQDILDLGATLRGLGHGYAAVHVATQIDEAVTVAAIREAKRRLARARVDDTVVIAVAGHGLYSRDTEADYFFVTHDADIGRLRDTAASFDLIESLLDGVAPRRKLLLLDTCESGDRDPGEAPALARAGKRGLRAKTARGVLVVKDPAGAAPAPRLFLTDRDRYIYNDLARRTGAIVFSSARGDEASFERKDLANGVFTEAMLAAFSGAADADADGTVSTDELRAFVSAQVQQMTDDLQHPTVDRDNLEQRFGFPLAQAER